VIAFAVLLATVVVLFVLLVVSYNGLVRLRNKVVEAWSGIEVQLQRRHDLIPNLVEAVRGYAAHERELFDQVAAARTLAQAADGPAEAGPAEAAVTVALGRLVAVGESYPDLRASENFVALQHQLAETENEIAAARRIFNGNVQIYNTRVETFPNAIWAGSFGFVAADFFEAEPAARQAPSAVGLPAA